jgi:hypothetical protein
MKNAIKKIAYGVGTAVLTLPALAGAQFKQPTSGETGLPSNSIYNILSNGMKWLLGLVGIIGVIGFAIAGIMYLTAAGDEGRIETAKKAMLMSIVGVVVALVGLVALGAASGLLGGTSTSF